MAQTLAEKLLSAKVGRTVEAGELVVCPVDVCMAHDGNRPLVTDVFVRLGAERVFDPERIKFVFDHAPSSHIPLAAQVQRDMCTFAREQGIEVIEVGEGICHQVLPERGHVVPGDVVVGTDSHTTTLGAFHAFATGVGSTDLAVVMKTGRIWLKVPSSVRVILRGRLRAGVYAKDVALALLRALTANGATYKALEFDGPALAHLGVGERMTLANLAMEMGAKAALFPCDAVLTEWLRQRPTRRPWQVFTPDPDARYDRVVELDLDQLEPLVAAPHRPDNVHPLKAYAGLPVQVAIIGTCVNGRYEDLREAARILRGRRVAKGVRLYVTPASREVYRRCLAEGVIADLMEAGAVIGVPGCSGCTAASGFGLPAPGERVISSGNRNFKGRLGTPEAEVFLASPAAVATAALTGCITDPRTVLREEAMAR